MTTITDTTIECPRCDGDGSVVTHIGAGVYQYGTCGTCGGDGVLAHGHPGAFALDCPACEAEMAAADRNA